MVLARALRKALLAFGMAGAVALGCLVAAPAAKAVPFGAYTAVVQPSEVFPGADRFGPLEGTPPAMAAYKGDKLVGYVFETSDIGYSGKPIKILAGLNTDGVIVGAKVTEHHEPILLVGIPGQKLFDFVNGYVGKKLLDVTAADAKRPVVDIIAGATVTAMVVDDGLLRTALKIARTRGLAGFAETPEDGKVKLAAVPFAKRDWTQLLGDGSVRRLSLTNAEVDQAFAKIGVGQQAYEKPGAPDATFIDLHVALLNPEIIGHNLLGDDGWKWLQSWLAPGESAIVIAANGEYSFRGSGYVRGGIFDRIQLIQEGVSIRFTDHLYRRVGNLEAGAPDFAEIGVFKMPPGVDFDPARPFRLDLLAQRATGARTKAFTTFSIDYSLPAALVTHPAPKPAAKPAVAEASQSTAAGASAESDDEIASRTALWQGIWHRRIADIGILSVSLGILTLIFFFQDWLVQRPKLFQRLRYGFLTFTIVWIGGYAGAQLSVVNVFTFTHSLMTQFRWDFFLMEPVIFLLWCATAASLLFWGRGAYCGWLCPFGAVQELLSAFAKKVGIRQINLKFAWNERLWAFKYVGFLALFALSLKSVATAERFAEIEPFKTVWLLHFGRSWEFVLWALVALSAGLFIERAYCRYICPLGAALAIPGRVRLFDWLKRRKQCGFECTKCARECMVQAIHPNGHINPNECLYCMHCQVVYRDNDHCTPLMLKRQARAKKAAAATEALNPAAKPAAVGTADATSAMESAE